MAVRHEQVSWLSQTATSAGRPGYQDWRQGARASELGNKSNSKARWILELVTKGHGGQARRQGASASRMPPDVVTKHERGGRTECQAGQGARGGDAGRPGDKVRARAGYQT